MIFKTLLFVVVCLLPLCFAQSTVTVANYPNTNCAGSAVQYTSVLVGVCVPTDDSDDGPTLVTRINATAFSLTEYADGASNCLGAAAKVDTRRIGVCYPNIDSDGNSSVIYGFASQLNPGLNNSYTFFQYASCANTSASAILLAGALVPNACIPDDDDNESTQYLQCNATHVPIRSYTSSRTCTGAFTVSYMRINSTCDEDAQVAFCNGPSGSSTTGTPIVITTGMSTTNSTGTGTSSSSTGTSGTSGSRTTSSSTSTARGTTSSASSLFFSCALFLGAAVVAL